MRREKSKQFNLLMEFATMSPQKKVIALITFLLLSMWSINTFIAPDTEDEMYNQNHITRPKDLAQVDLSTLKETAAKHNIPKDFMYEEDDEDIDKSLEDDESRDAAVADMMANAEDDEFSYDDGFYNDLFFDDFDDSYIAIYRASAIEYNLLGISTEAALGDATSPQGQAFEWIVNGDERMVYDDDANLIQRYVMAVLWFATSGENWIEDGLKWMSELHECQWNKKGLSRITGGIICDDDLMISTIDLSDHNLVGPLPVEIGYLHSLQHLYLDNNRLTGGIPATIGLLTNLTNLYLDHNSLSGIVPNQFEDMVNLAEIQISNNDLWGTVPSSICKLTEEEKLYIVISDCEGDPASIECSCCTECCDGLDYCFFQIDGIDDDL